MKKNLTNRIIYFNKKNIEINKIKKVKKIVQYNLFSYGMIIDMWRKKKERIPSENFCILCGRYTNDKKFPSEDWTNQFFVCNNCKKVWCASCMGQVSGLGPNKTHKLGKKGAINCPDCGKTAFMIKLPTNLPFIQKKNVEIVSDISQIGDTPNYCTYCGETIPEDAQFCHICGTKQK